MRGRCRKNNTRPILNSETNKRPPNIVGRPYIIVGRPCYLLRTSEIKIGKCFFFYTALFLVIDQQFHSLLKGEFRKKRHFLGIFPKMGGGLKKKKAEVQLNYA